VWRHDDGVDRTWRAVEKEFVRACEAYVTGRFAAYLDDRGRPVPEWAWANVLAHGSLAQLRGLAAERRVHHYLSPAARSWERALAFLADQVLLAGEAHADGAFGVQRDILWPLETVLCRYRSRHKPPTPEHLVQTVTAALEGIQRGPTSGRCDPR
jgi:hypothetical protein